MLRSRSSVTVSKTHSGVNTFDVSVSSLQIKYSDPTVCIKDLDKLIFTVCINKLKLILWFEFRLKVINKPPKKLLLTLIMVNGDSKSCLFF